MSCLAAAEPVEEDAGDAGEAVDGPAASGAATVAADDSAPADGAAPAANGTSAAAETAANGSAGVNGAAAGDAEGAEGTPQPELPPTLLPSTEAVLERAGNYAPTSISTEALGVSLLRSCATLKAKTSWLVASASSPGFSDRRITVER